MSVWDDMAIGFVIGYGRFEFGAAVRAVLAGSATAGQRHAVETFAGYVAS